MAVYKDLLLREGGGILPFAQMAEELEDKAAILIGLGGTGIDCLREIKKAVRGRIRPEDPKADRKKWRNIHFLAVDSDPESGIQEFEQEEQVPLYDIPVRRELRSLKRIIDFRPELEWLDEALIGMDFGGGAGEIRQIGRFLFMERSNVFVSRMQKLLARAKAEAGKPVLIYIFTGLGGGTGSGIFLDVCYLIRHIAENYSRGNVLLSGYFFLPDVNLERIPHSASVSRSHVKRNGYAAMQELDYCMRLPQNGGSFTQTYKGGVKAEWNVPPVDLCWLLSATDRSFLMITNPYCRTVKFAAEYVVDGLLKPWNVWQLELTHMGEMMRHADQEKRHGYHLHYLSPGGSSMVLPRREILTYLTSKVFEVFSGMSDHDPSEAEVQAIADAARIASVEALLSDLTKNGGNSDLATALDTFDMKFIRDCGDEQLLYHYTNQKADKMGIIVKNARSMMDERDNDSLIARICAQLDACVMDLNRGPSYAYKVVQASFAGNMFNIIDGIIWNVQTRLDQRNHNVYEQSDSASKLYEESRQIWYAEKNKNRRKANRAFDQYVADMENFIREQIEIAQLEQLLAVMRKLKEQVQKKADEYYLKFSRVMDNLTATFAENRNALNNGTNAVNSNSYAVPMMNIQQICSLLDREVRQMDMPGLLRQFVTCMFTPDWDGNPVWIREEESRIAEAVRQFFAERAFPEIANSSMSQLAAAVTGQPAAAAVKMMLERGGMDFLKDASKIVFPPDQCIYGGPYNEMVQIAVPDGDDTVLLAVENAVKSDGIRVRKSAQRDRISMFRFMAGFPVSAYANCGWYGKAYWEDFWPGRHLYTGTGGSALFHDWNRMPPLTPRSLMTDGKLPARVKALFQEAEELYEEAVAMGVIEGDVIFCVPDEVPGELEGMMKRAQEICSWIRQFPDFSDNAMASNMKKLLTELREEYCFVRQPSGYRMDSGSAPTAEICERIRRDFFLSSPALHTVVRREMEKLEGYTELYRQWNAYKEGKDRWFGIRNFCMALCTGVFTWDMAFRISCDIEVYGIPVSELLTDFMQQDRFPYALLPLYQSYLSCMDLEEEKKQAIIDEAKRRWYDCENSPEVVKCVRACEAKIDNDYARAFLQMASKYPEKEQEMRQFIRMFMRELEAMAALLKVSGVYDVEKQ